MARSIPVKAISKPARARVLRRPMRPETVAAMTPVIAALSNPMLRMRPMTLADRPWRSR